MWETGLCSARESECGWWVRSCQYQYWKLPNRHVYVQTEGGEPERMPSSLFYIRFVVVQVLKAGPLGV